MKTSWTYLVRNEEVLHRVKEDRNFLNAIKRDKGLGRNLCRNGLLNHVTEGKTERLSDGKMVEKT